MIFLKVIKLPLCEGSKYDIPKGTVHSRTYCHASTNKNRLILINIDDP
jgi:hypothetical protein